MSLIRLRGPVLFSKIILLSKKHPRQLLFCFDRSFQTTSTNNEEIINLSNQVRMKAADAFRQEISQFRNLTDEMKIGPSMEVYERLKPLKSLTTSNLQNLVLAITKKQLQQSFKEPDPYLVQCLKDVTVYITENQQVCSASLWTSILNAYVCFRQNEKCPLVAEMALSWDQGCLTDQQQTNSTGLLYGHILKCLLLGNVDASKRKMFLEYAKSRLGDENSSWYKFFLYTLAAIQNSESAQPKLTFLIQRNALSQQQSQIAFDIFTRLSCFDQGLRYLNQPGLTKNSLPSNFIFANFLKNYWTQTHNTAKFLEAINNYCSIAKYSSTRLLNLTLGILFRAIPAESDKKSVESLLSQLSDYLSKLHAGKPNIVTANTLISGACLLKDKKWYDLGMHFIDQFGLKPTVVTFRSSFIAFGALSIELAGIQKLWNSLNEFLASKSMTLSRRDYEAVRKCVLELSARKDASEYIEWFNSLLEKERKLDVSDLYLQEQSEQPSLKEAGQ
ncbi:hypothetical protein SJAG_01446 [Schizosaccharomyces japonicus yFS275]|uniref:Uncharacterized protein n=1 Tax=Schizosaccharomyces japonicus (strain yFS275 / FY16936) TaxID=402676 RepID=B6JXY6_SCHJY|nr:hypothetical protein SJAG_01446 [Schizosaccharomyces japonicus yFS275]EEB06404.2 hypothetical protein SJAG_01446 [Schizosaccharomyces japonicus yFS275]